MRTRASSSRFQDGGCCVLCQEWIKLPKYQLCVGLQLAKMATEPSVSTSHIDHLLAEVESSDGLLGPTLRYREALSCASVKQATLHENVYGIRNGGSKLRCFLITGPYTMANIRRTSWKSLKKELRFTTKTLNECATITTKASLNQSMNYLKFEERPENSRYRPKLLLIYTLHMQTYQLQAAFYIINAYVRFID